MVKEQPGNLVYGLYANSDSNRPQSQVTLGAPPARLLDGTADDPDGNVDASRRHVRRHHPTALRQRHPGLVVGGRRHDPHLLRPPLKIGGNAIWGEWFSGLIDEVRVYNRALSVDEIQSDMNTSISSPDSTPPSAPGTLTATGGLGKVTLSWSAATDNVGVVRYDVYRGTASGLHAECGESDRAADRHELLGYRPECGYLLLQGHGRGRGRQRRPDRQRSKRDRHRRHDPADCAGEPGRDRRRRSGRAHLGCLDRRGRHRSVQRPSLHDERASHRAQPTESPSRRGRATRTRAWRRARTSTR